MQQGSHRHPGQLFLCPSRNQRWHLGLLTQLPPSVMPLVSASSTHRSPPSCPQGLQPPLQTQLQASRSRAGCQLGREALITLVWLLKLLALEISLTGISPWNNLQNELLPFSGRVTPLLLGRCFYSSAELCLALRAESNPCHSSSSPRGSPEQGLSFPHLKSGQTGPACRYNLHLAALINPSNHDA